MVIRAVPIVESVLLLFGDDEQRGDGECRSSSCSAEKSCCEVPRRIYDPLGATCSEEGSSCGCVGKKGVVAAVKKGSGVEHPVGLLLRGYL